MIPYGRQNISEEDIQAVVDVLRSDFLTQGPAVPRFEQAIGAYCSVPHAIAVNSATSALHIACLTLGVSAGDVVWTSPNTFVASANCARYCGASVDFVDIDPLTYNLCPSALRAKLEQAERNGKLPKVVIPVHFAGQPCDMAAIHALSKHYGFKIIEDASHAIGARYGETVIGDCRYSDITVFSFHPVKIITTAEGGAVTTRSDDWARKMRSLRSHGISRDVKEMLRPEEGPWYYEQHALGWNYRMTDMQAALGVSQMSRLDSWIERRHRLADFYGSALSDLPLQLPVRPEGSRSALHLYPIQIDTKRTELSRRTVFERLRAADIGVNVHYIPVHLQPYYQDLGFATGQFPNAEAYYERAISLPLYAHLSEGQQQQVIASVEQALVP